MGKRISLRALCALLLLVGLLASSGSIAAAGPPQQGGFFALSGADAAAYQLPPDTLQIETFAANDLVFTRYQQMAGPHQARVLGAEITIATLADGQRTLVVGSYFPGVQPSNGVAITPDQAKASARGRVGSGDETSTLMIDPDTRRHLYQVETRRETERAFTLVDAQTGEVVDSYSAIMEDHGTPFASCNTLTPLPPCGLGVEYDSGSPDDVKNLSGLTFRTDTGHEARSPDGRQIVFSQFLSTIASDDDDAWTTLGDVASSQQAITDLIAYTGATDDALISLVGFDFPAERGGPFQAVAHYGTNYNNAFWNGSAAFFGDGDQISYRELTPLDVVAHEFAHGVTDLTSDLVYRDQSGALNESFSDVVGNVAEFWAEPNGREPAVALAPDWLIGEDLSLVTDVAPGFRNMADPEEDGDPDHFSELLTGRTDNGWVHVNSGIPNHAFYLLVNGGQNASCVSPPNHNAGHCSDTTDTQDNGVTVAALGLDAAFDIWFTGFSALSSGAKMCDAKAATVAAAGLPDSPAATSTRNAWLAVGVTDKACTVTTKGNKGGGGPKPR